MKDLSIVILLLWLSASVYAQDQLTIQFDYAKTLYKTEQYFDAITEYKRLLFFDSAKTYTYLANFKIGKCYKTGAKFDDAIKYFSISEMNSTTDDECYQAKIEIVRSNILRHTTSRAFQLLDEVGKDPKYASKTDSVNYWRGWAYLFDDDWDNASKSFAKINTFHELKRLSDQIVKDKYSVTFAKVISYILPGAGQIYTGNYSSGFMSLGYNILFGYLTVNSFLEERVFDGVMIGGLLWLRFYRGNVQNAERFVIEKNIEISNRALRFLQNEYKGAKP